ncbi:RagB/SusD family nutrient uptake outer membrane protein [Antarcticibacterium sp. 1MA-6-2]|uniref:RagB/SusD family nutrient uptake outer membrane protein n=1 Tax=Antarcticibacterium sp. 1MA-6-2 TaxID=2908210 RepID=UPI001F38FF37|nr:RagB/SusD family nutrient uptake outer membrane protein [Antarcticibacterium sp. 1MA-6-2]UJH89876.1 RagB/SusD family nutrient uptake outer membrane protein [Antarcticibacterium sp. 1MA-6-2]
MKKYITYRLFFSMLALSFIACDDNLDIEPEQDLSPEVATESPSNIMNILNSIYADLRSDDAYAGGIALISELLGNTGDLSWNGTYLEPGEFDEKAVVAANSFVSGTWLNAYQINNQANIVLANLDVFDDEDARNRAEGEAKFLRALNYFDLLRLYAKPYEQGANGGEPGVPLILEPVLNASQIAYPPRNTIEEVYTQILNDLNAAYELLPSDNGYFADKYTAQALLARVYLQRGDYEEARDAANDVIENSDASLTNTFAGAFNNPENSSEDLFAIQVTAQDASINAYNEYWGGNDFGGRPGDPDISILEPHYGIYDSEQDDRANFFYETDRGTATTKWQNQFGNIPVIRLAEMYLIRAEANERLGTEVGATPLEDINTLRERARAPRLSSVDLETILEERRRELAFEGFALFDAKRLGRDVGDITYDANRLVLPIPLRETDANPQLEQNPGY